MKLSRRLLLQLLKGRRLVDMVASAETVEIEPQDGYRRHKATGKVTFVITTTR